MPKLTNVLRCTPTWEHPESLENFDQTLKEALTSILNIDFTEDAWIQASWPISRGGLGIRHASDLALPAFLSSVHSTHSLVDSILPAYIHTTADHHLTVGRQKWMTATGVPEPPPDLRNIQKEWEEPFIKKSINTAMERATNSQDKARLIGVASPESGSFLHAVPVSTLGTLMPDNFFRVSIALRLGVASCQPHQCPCGTPVTDLGIHGLSCRRSAGRSSRHSAVNTIIKRALASAGIPATLEPVHLSLDTNIRPDGATLIPWKNGKALVWDFTCVDSQAPSHVASASESSLSTATSAERLKITKYASLSTTHIFVPVAIECLGAIGKEGLAFLRDLGQKIKDNTGEPQASEYLFQRVSIAVQSGNAKAVIGTCPLGETLET